MEGKKMTKKKYLIPLMDIIVPELEAEILEISNIGTEDADSKKGSFVFDDEDAFESDDWSTQ